MPRRARIDIKPKSSVTRFWESSEAALPVPSLVRVSPARRARFRGPLKRPIIRKPAAGAKRCNMIGIVEPGEEGQLLQMVGKSVGAGHSPVVADPAQRIAHLKIILPAAR